MLSGSLHSSLPPPVSPTAAPPVSSLLLLCCQHPAQRRGFTECNKTSDLGADLKPIGSGDVVVLRSQVGGSHDVVHVEVAVVVLQQRGCEQRWRHYSHTVLKSTYGHLCKYKYKKSIILTELTRGQRSQPNVDQY